MFLRLPQATGFASSNAFFVEIEAILTNAQNNLPQTGQFKSPSMNALNAPADVTLPQLKAILNEVAMGLLKECQRCAPLIKGQAPIPTGTGGFDANESRRFVWNLS